MKTLWFKSRFVEAILSGAKTDTVRSLQSRSPGVGERVALSVGPRPAFAQAMITGVEEVRAADLGPQRRAEVTRLCGAARRFRRISFRLVHILPQRGGRGRAA